MKPIVSVNVIVTCLPFLALLGCSATGEPGAQSTPEALSVRKTAPLASPWTSLANAPPAFVDTCNLLTDGSIMCHEYGSNHWHRLRPDDFGSYANGLWDNPAMADMPDGNDASFGCMSCTYAPLYFSSAVLPDGRVVVIGGEYISGVSHWSNIGFIYDPVANSWSSQLTEQFGGGNVGDAMGIVLQNGTYVLSSISSTNLESLDPGTLTFTTLNPTGKLDVNDEEGWNLLYDGTLLAVDSRRKSSFEIYDPTTNTWGNSGSTGVNLADTGGSPVGSSSEVGPGVLRPDGKLVYLSGNSSGQNALYDTSTGTWSNAAAMDFPLVSMQTYHYAEADGPASLLPNGNVLAMASPVINGTPFNKPSHFYEFDLATDTLNAVTDSPNAASFKSYQGRMLLLPTGEVLLTAYDQGSTQDAMLYSNGGVPQDAWRPVITSGPATVVPGSSYTISGRLFNGFSEGASYGDDAQSSTNYPLVRITNETNGHVAYARTHDHSRMGVERVGSTEIVTTHFDVPAELEPGPSTLVVVVNGIESAPFKLHDNHPPVAKCKPVTVAADAACHASASVDDGSFDPEGNPFACTAAPPSPYGLGATSVTLTCTDNHSESGSCTSVVTVTDGIAPVFTHVPSAVQIDVCVGANIGQATASDNCGAVTVTNDAPAKFPLGTTTVTWTATDSSGNSVTATQQVTAVLGDDPSCCPAGTNVIVGTNGADVLNGTAGSDCIIGKGGNDTINGVGGVDFISAGAGDDIVVGGFGNDYILGGGGNDTIDSGPGDDFVDGGSGFDNCSGGTGSNSITRCENVSFCTAACCATSTCVAPAPSSLYCNPTYAQAACGSYGLGTVVSTSGHNWECTNGNCLACGSFSSCAPGASGCPWGAVWTDRGPVVAGCP
jgi:Ca2+-binding RTX toxin-like protein